MNRRSDACLSYAIQDSAGRIAIQESAGRIAIASWTVCSLHLLVSELMVVPLGGNGGSLTTAS